jgi:hypothetical protein
MTIARRLARHLAGASKGRSREQRAGFRLESLRETTLPGFDPLSLLLSARRIDSMLQPGGRRRRYNGTDVFKRLLEWLGLRKQPPDIGVREPRRPVPSASGGAIALDPEEEH